MEIPLTPVQRVLFHAAKDHDFRSRFLQDMGLALAQDGFILTDSEMSSLRPLWETLRDLTERAAYERLAALARSAIG